MQTLDRFKLGTYHKMRNGNKACVGYRYFDDYLGFEVSKGGNIVKLLWWDSKGIVLQSKDHCYDLISEWQEQEVFIVGDMLRHIFIDDSTGELHEGAIAKDLTGTHYAPHPNARCIAILKSHEWEACKRGERQLLIGEGLNNDNPTN